MSTTFFLAFVMLRLDILRISDTIPSCIPAGSSHRALVLQVDHPIDEKPIAIICIDGQAWFRYKPSVGIPKARKMVMRTFNNDFEGTLIRNSPLAKVHYTIKHKD